MTNALAVYENIDALQSAATALHASGYFSDVKSQAQAMAKVMAGAEIGLPPFAAMSGIHIIQGKPVIGANLIATLIKNDPRYDFRITRADEKECVIEWREGGQMVGQSTFTMSEAQAAGLTGKDNWKKYPSDMLFARALTRGARRYAPGIFGGAPIYTPDEMGAETDEDGQVINVTPAPTPPQPANGGDPGPLPDDEVIIYEAPAGQFIAAVAGLLDTNTDDVKERLKALGYTGISKHTEKRLDVYRRLRDERPQSDPAQDDLFGEPAAAVVNGGGGGSG